jgi:serine/threonine protein kinase
MAAASCQTTAEPVTCSRHLRGGLQLRPAENLTGVKLQTGWTVESIVSKKPTATGGNFSTGYRVRHDDGREGFLKAMDYTEALRAFDAAQALKSMTESYLFEKRICDSCKDANLRRVVRAIESGSIIPKDASQAFARVEYLIFELADGDIRNHLDAQQKFDMAFALRVLHNTAVGLEQLHNTGMAHQDLKPSNVLVFSEERGGGSKIGDLGRAWASDIKSPHDHLIVAGDRGYAPPELVYNSVATDARSRRLACDMYHFGSMISFMFSKVHMTAYLAKHLAPGHRIIAWGGTYEDVLPYVQAAFAAALKEIEPNIPEPYRDELIEMVRQLCEPDPQKRGHPHNRIGDTMRFSLNRYISRLDYLAKKAEYHMVGK